MGDELYKGMMVGLSAAIAIVVLLLIFMRPSPEYFSELYFSDHTNIPELIDPMKTYIADFRIVNHEKETTEYNITISADLGHEVLSLADEVVSIEKGKYADIHLPYIMPDFERAKITIRADDLEIYFWVIGSQSVIMYPDYPAYQSCLKTLIVPEGDVFISAKGAYGPNMQVRTDGNIVFEQIINNSEYEEYYVGKRGSTLDIIFDNDHYDKKLDHDTNLYINYIRIGNQTYGPKTGILDRGKRGRAFDCEQTLERDGRIVWNGALRWKFD